MDGWKNLELDNLPDWFGKEDYDFQVYHVDNDKWYDLYKYSRTIATIIGYLRCNSLYHYRKSESEQPTHEEIMTKWWKIERNWKRVVSYDATGGGWYTLHNKNSAIRSLFFLNLESASTPPESN